MADKELIEKIRKFVEKECKKPKSNYPTAYKYHFVSMHKIAKKLAKQLNADVELVEIAAWLHDIGSIIKGRENHHITGAEIAEKLLKKLNYSEDRIEKVKQCILNHRGSQETNNHRDFIESKIIVEIDVFDNFSKQFLVTLVHEKKTMEESKLSIQKFVVNQCLQAVDNCSEIKISGSSTLTCMKTLQLSKISASRILNLEFLKSPEQNTRTF